MSAATEPATPAPGAPAAVRDDLAEVAEAAERVLRTAAELDPDGLAGPSLLPGWTRGHVLAHLARNADSLVNLLTGAREGRDIPAYADGDARERGIREGAGRPLDEQLADLAAAQERFAAAAASLPDEAWSSRVRHRSGYLFPASEIPAKRLQELEYHHVDLGAGYTPAHWTAGFAARELERLAARYRGEEGVPAVRLLTEGGEHDLRIGAADGEPELTVEGPVRGLVAWLSGRSDGDGLQVHRGDDPLADPRTALPELPPMA
ncbi:maleylpyruvate isomerase family mycothiol-dependent enzyme [Streptacidiphilus sp. ASG 303]|uniref:maleylpyruvate isomerase family mycothiol-dependent enzyme n=1 Tax=Streptacidiphilus sp. ASG 303 TaxID=2896847 RepID=UPI001E3F52AA|nr:maleylpyruvate isomerase family mycothiol-dependent enzyme [Streptacidiphilus sp. ASG 303]MCD0483096.1 maleylpyruvate isomerase family mycothiol-dependent enzyme [Streptacidiphilus sp. ASG 303]